MLAGFLWSKRLWRLHVQKILQWVHILGCLGRLLDGAVLLGTALLSWSRVFSSAGVRILGYFISGFWVWSILLSWWVIVARGYGSSVDSWIRVSGWRSIAASFSYHWCLTRSGFDNTFWSAAWPFSSSLTLFPGLKIWISFSILPWLF